MKSTTLRVNIDKSRESLKVGFRYKSCGFVNCTKEELISSIKESDIVYIERPSIESKYFKTAKTMDFVEVLHNKTNISLNELNKKIKYV